ncbi:hypothetical protein JTE90_018046 [Oedothorax gibbosus]|uniref:Reverse transcriptase domain-containing protein n=1 Tax=Oedothorax gibbosus TaxID=931172 RepID=A0AAV6THP9_9ARAC|nr:hypothetical protein JTE90_018046 [Oedothorax gibbosus]
MNSTNGTEWYHRKSHQANSWVNPVVIVPKKDNSLRICLDPRHLNKRSSSASITRPISRSATSKAKRSRGFSLLDAKNAFYNTQLDDQSSDLCTLHHTIRSIGFWSCHLGPSCAPEVFQMAMDTLFENHADINPYFDYIIIHSETLNDHYEKLKTVLEVARQNGLKNQQGQTTNRCS